jgi:PKD repeat protein
MQSLIVLLLFFLLCGCSGSKNPGNPVVPSESRMDTSPSLSANTVYPSNRYMLGLWSFHVDPAFQTVTGSQMRTADMHLNLVRLLEQACTDCLTFSNADFSVPGQLSIDMTVKHPFQNELILTAFDLRGIFITDDLNTSFFPDIAWGEELPSLLNRDGYTGLFNEENYPFNPDEPAVFNYYPGILSSGGTLSAAVNPFVAYGEENPRRMFLPGTEETRTLTIKLPGMSFDFGYAVDACWALPEVEPVTDPVSDFPMTANCTEPYEIQINIGEGLTTTAGSKALIEVEIFDHQGLDTIENELNSPLKRIYAWLYAPGTDYYFISWISPTGPYDYFEYSTATGEDSFLFNAELYNPGNIEEGIYPLEVYVASTEQDPNFGSIYAYNVIPVYIPAVSDSLPVAEGMAYPIPQTIGVPVGFYDNGTYDPDGGSIVKWEWDWNVDGTFDGEGNPAYHTFNTPGTYYVNLRVTDDEGSTRTLFEPLEVVIKEGPGWARTWGSENSDQAWAVAVDGEGNVYVGGPFQGTTDFDPSPLEAIRTLYPSPQGGDDSYISKFDNEGNFIWVRTMGGDYDDLISAITINDLGNLIVVGDFWLDLTFEGDPSSQVFNAEGYTDNFLCSYSPEGNFLWAKTWGGSDKDYTNVICDDSSGNIYVGGAFSGIADFDPGPNSVLRTAHQQTEAFIEKFNPAGDFIWVNTWGSEPYDVYNFRNFVSGIDVDANGNVYCSGSFQGIVDFDPGPGEDFHEVVGWSPNPPNPYSDIFMSKFSSAGEYQWVKTWGGIYGDMGYDLAIDNLDNINVLGYFEGPVDFDPGPGIYELTETSQYSDPFLSRFDTDGNFIWAKSWNADFISPYSGLGMGIDNDNNIYVTGTFVGGNTDFDPSPEIANTTWYGSSDYYLSKFDIEGEFLWVRSWGGAGQEGFGYDVAIDSSDYASVIGGYRETADFDPGPGIDLHTAPSQVTPGNLDAFVTHFPPDGNW